MHSAIRNILFGFVLMLAFAAASNAEPLRITGQNIDPLPINAGNFDETVINQGTISASGAYPFDFLSTKIFTNELSGVIDIGSGGLVFDYNGDFGRRPLSQFVNKGRIASSGLIEINATNILNDRFSTIDAPRIGAIRLNGDNVDLRSSTLSASGADGNFFFSGGNISTNDFVLPSNHRIDGWAITQNYRNDNRGDDPVLRSSSLFSSGFLNVPFHFGDNISSFSFPSVSAFDWFLGATWSQNTNNTIQAKINLVFIDTNVLTGNLADYDVDFFYSGTANNIDNLDSIVQFQYTEADPTSVGSAVSGFTIRDSLAGDFPPLSPTRDPDLDLLREVTHRDMFRPESHDISASASFFSLTSPAMLQPFTNEFFYTTTARSQNLRYASNVVAFEYARTDFTVSPYDYPGTGFGFGSSSEATQSFTNSPGRVEINATGNVDLDFATISAENLIRIRAKSVTGLTNAVIDAPNIQLEVEDGAESFTFDGSIPSSVRRLNGDMRVFSAAWENTQFVTNNINDFVSGVFNVPAIYRFMVEQGMINSGAIRWALSTNTVEYLYQITVIDHNVATNMPVNLDQISIPATNFNVESVFAPSRELIISGESLVIATNGAILPGGGLLELGGLQLPNLANFTNNGLLQVSSLVLGPDTTNEFINIVNNSNIVTGSAHLKSRYFENNALLSNVVNNLDLDCETNRLYGGSIYNGGVLRVSGADLVATNSSITNIGAFVLAITNRVSDRDFTNLWQTSGGLRMLTKPFKGDLLSTSIQTFAAQDQVRVHSWAGEDRGDTAGGYRNNVAIGRLILDGETNGVFRFGSETGAAAAMYVDVIEFRNNATNFADVLQLTPDMTIYFAETAGNVPADKLTNAYPNRLVWVSETTRQGPSMNVQLSMSQSTNMTLRAFRSLTYNTLDADNDGLVNSIDTTPISGFTIGDVRYDAESGIVNVVWQAMSGISYTVQRRLSIDQPWEDVVLVIPSEDGPFTYVAPGNSNKNSFYRIRFEKGLE